MSEDEVSYEIGTIGGSCETYKFKPSTTIREVLQKLRPEDWDTWVLVTHAEDPLLPNDDKLEQHAHPGDKLCLRQLPKQDKEPNRPISQSPVPPKPLEMAGGHRPAQSAPMRLTESSTRPITAFDASTATKLDPEKIERVRERLKSDRDLCKKVLSYMKSKDADSYTKVVKHKEILAELFQVDFPFD